MVTQARRDVILIVDDYPVNVEILVELLSSSGYIVHVASNGSSALQIATEETPDLILLDIMMRGMDGFETCRHLKEDERTADIPIIFITALTETSDKLKGFQLGAVDYITKPIQPTEVLARVATHLMLYHQRREIERLREQDRIYFEKLSAMKDELMQIASHDLKNPLNTIIGALYLLEQHGILDDDKGKYFIEKIRHNVDRILKLIHDLLEIARIETGLALEKRYANLNPFLNNALDDFMLAAQEKNIRLIFSPLSQDIKIALDFERMTQVLQNLLSNAIKYNPAGGTVELSAEIVEHELFIHVSDTGLGIPADAMPHLFKKFFRVNLPEHLNQEGNGLGLPIVKTIVEQHGGHVMVNSVLGKGSTFTISLPLATVH